MRVCISRMSVRPVLLPQGGRSRAALNEPFVDLIASVVSAISTERRPQHTTEQPDENLGEGSAAPRRS